MGASIYNYIIIHYNTDKNVVLYVYPLSAQGRSMKEKLQIMLLMAIGFLSALVISGAIDIEGNKSDIKHIDERGKENSKAIENTNNRLNSRWDKK